MNRITLNQWMEENSREIFLQKFEQKCQGNYEAIFSRCGGGLAIESLQGGYKHVDCPQHSGKNGKNYRAIKGTSNLGPKPFNDFAFGTCNTCGTKSGIGHLMWLRGDAEMKETRKVIKDAMGWTWGEILNDPRLDANISPAEYRERQKRMAEDEKKQNKIREDREKKLKDEALRKNVWIDKKLKELFATCVPLAHKKAEPARKYYQSRGIPDVASMSDTLTKWIRFSESVHIVINGIDYGWYMAIVSKIVGGKGEILNAHQIIIDENGHPLKPSVVINGELHTAESPKIKTPSKQLVDNSNRGIKPFSADLVQAVCEGQEVGLAANFYDKLPVDMAADANGMIAWVPKESVKVALILVDNDLPSRKDNISGGTGVAAGLKLREKLFDIGVVPLIIYPNWDIPEGSKSVDLNDVYANFKNQYSPKILKEWDVFEEKLRKNSGHVTEELLNEFEVPLDGIVYMQ
ncbi:hypothetical protein A1QO_00735 [Vibrio genomosp. F10 str. ZF-129]|uniref:Toprim domain-containing protein n=1 Tax=Vibrio genomosp. F10 str. ZF-129 TaxID=1187848 RepID=A0A1E5BGD5_9VIBR|nr:hypothetical protein [Vibrio genomosp. F10]OEE35318.1 hypothetical protein A1QO_00735 [Vibrio genomosp. F10 str. ZF-129]